MASEAWVTLATNDSYAVGVLVLAYSLKAAKTTRPLVVMVSDQVSPAMREKLSELTCKVHQVNIMDSQDSAHLALLARPELGITFTKLHCWTLTDFSKCVFLDADTLVIQNCDELFERDELSAAPDVGWPDCFNSGVFVFRPSMETYSKLVDFAVTEGSFDGGDQGLLNSYFSDWSTKDISRRLPFIYNMTTSSAYTYKPAYNKFGKDVKIVHFIGATKPWQVPYRASFQTSVASEHVDLWWDILSNQVMPHLSTGMKKSPKREIPPPQDEDGVSCSTIAEVLRPDNFEPAPTPSENVETAEAEEVPLPVETPASVELSVVGGETVPVKETSESLDESLSEVGVAAQLAQLSIDEDEAGSSGAISNPEVSREENIAQHRQKWERGDIDYAGVDAFDNIMGKILKTLDSHKSKP